MVLDQEPGPYDVLAMYDGDTAFTPSSDARTFRIAWEHTFTDDSGAGTIFLNPSTRQFRFVAPGDDAGIKRDPHMQTFRPNPDGGAVVMAYRDADLTLNGTFDLARGAFTALVVTANGHHILRAVR